MTDWYGEYEDKFSGRARLKRCLPWWVTVPSVSLYRESEMHAHVEQERADHFRCFDGGSTEVEIRTGFNATCMLLKPTSILETGTMKGLAAWRWRRRVH